MYQLIKDIAKRSYEAAAKRGQDVACVACLQKMYDETTEYWQAYDKGDTLTAPDEKIIAAEISRDKDFVDFYDHYIHHTTYDELADVLLVAATWTHSAQLDFGPEYVADRNFDTMLAASAVPFITNQLHNSKREIAIFTAIVYLKLRYNELRKD